MKHILLCFFAVMTFNFCSAQVSLTATAGTTGPTLYGNLESAFDAINAGIHQGVITITINGNTTEVTGAVLNASGSGGGVSYTSVSIKPTGGIASSIGGNVPGPLVDFNGADNVTIDGLNTGGNSLTISNQNTGTASTIRFINDATSNIIQNTTIRGGTTIAASGTVFFSTGTTTGNDNNTISNCSIADMAGVFPVNAIYSAGNAVAGQENSGITISNNNISNFFNADLVNVGIFISTGNTDWTISGNRLFQTATRTFTTANTHRGIQISSGNNYKIFDNIIGFASQGSTGTYTMAGTIATRFIAIDLAVGSTTASSVQNNTISNFLLGTSSGASTANGIWCGINITSGDVNVGTVTGNTIGATSGTGSVTLNSTSASGLAAPINSSSTGNINIANNSIGSIDVLPSGALSGNIYAIQTSGASGTISISNNTIGSATANNLRVGVAGTTTGNGIVRGVLAANSGTVSITGNIIRNLTHNSNNSLALFRVIEFQQGTGTISGNTITNVSANGTSTTALTPEGAGILITTAVGGLTVDANIISGLSVVNTTPATGPFVFGIYLGSSVTNVSLTRNKIFGIANAGTSSSTTTPPTIAGIYCRDAGAGSPNIFIANNMISLGNSQTTNTAIIGIWNSTASVNGLLMKIYYNSVNIEGTAVSGAQPSFCYYRGDFSATTFTTPTVDIRDNIFTNLRSGGTGKHYAISNSYGSASSSPTGWGTNASDYNVLNANAATIGYWGGDQNFAGWQTASASDGHSLSGITVNYVNSASDLHLVTTSNSAVDGKAIPIGAVTTDFDGNTRNVVTPDLGADEFTAGALAISLEYLKGMRQGNTNILNWKANCNSPSIIFDVQRSADGRNFAGITNFSVTQSRCLLPFDITDNNPLAGVNYYRLRMTEADGKISYSMIVAIIYKESGFELVGLMPTLVNGSAVLNVSTAKKTNLEILISDVSGKTVNRQTVIAEAGSNTIRLDLANLSKGNYQLTVYTPAGNAGTIRFVKQ